MVCFKRVIGLVFLWVYGEVEVLEVYVFFDVM